MIRPSLRLHRSNFWEVKPASSAESFQTVFKGLHWRALFMWTQQSRRYDAATFLLNQGRLFVFAHQGVLRQVILKLLVMICYLEDQHKD